MLFITCAHKQWSNRIAEQKKKPTIFLFLYDHLFDNDFAADEGVYVDIINNQ